MSEQNEAPMKTASTSMFLNQALVALATEHAEEIEHNRQLAERLGGLMTISVRAQVAKGPLAGRTLQVSIAIDPEDED